ncbi:MAG: MFS transporter [Anaerolineaceae bacterium]|nr:MFS transporter [Anaerolineaceae bacterium]
MTSSTKQAADSLTRGSAKLSKVLVYYAAYLVLGLSLSALGPTLPGLAKQTGSTLGQISIIFAGNSFGYIIGSLLSGWVFDRRKGHPVIAIAMSFLALLMIVLPLVPSRGLLVLIIMLIGFLMAFQDVGGNTLIVWLFGHKVGPYMNALHLCFGLGAFLSPMLVDRVIVATGGIRGVYWILAALLIPVIIWMLRTPSPERQKSANEGGSGFSLRPYVFLLIMTAALFFMHVGTEMAYGGWIFSYAVALNIGPDTLARVLNSTYWGGLMIGRLVAIPLAIKMRPKTMLLLDLLGSIGSIGVLLVFPLWPASIWIATFGLGFSIASMYPSTLNFAERRMPITGQVTSYLIVGANAGSMVIPWVIGQAFESSGPQSMMWIMQGAMLLALMLFFGIMVYSKRLPRQIGKELDVN